MNPLTTILQLGITEHWGYYDAETRTWKQWILRDADGVTIRATGTGPTPHDAMAAALLDMRTRIARAMGGGAEVVL